MLLSNAVLTLCRTRLIDLFGINNISSYLHTKKHTNLLGSHLTKETINKLTTFSSVASGENPYKMYVLEEERMLAAITTLLSNTSN